MAQAEGFKQLGNVTAGTSCARLKVRIAPALEDRKQEEGEKNEWAGLIVTPPIQLSEQTKPSRWQLDSVQFYQQDRYLDCVAKVLLIKDNLIWTLLCVYAIHA